MTPGNTKGLAILIVALSIAALWIYGIRRDDQKFTPGERAAHQLEKSQIIQANADSSLARFQRLAESVDSWGVVFTRAYINDKIGTVVVTDDWYGLPAFQQERLVTSIMNMWAQSAVGFIDRSHVAVADNWGKVLAWGRFRSDGSIAVDLK